MEYGYIRTSTQEQNESRQVEAMKAEGIDNRYIYLDKMSGKNFNRPSYNLLVGTDTTAPLLREGDLLTIYSIDRLGRDYTEIRKQWEYITKELKADIRVLDMPLLDTRAANGRDLDSTFVSELVLQILSYVAQKERENMLARQKAGIACMKVDGETGKKIGKKGRPTGRPQAEFPEGWEQTYTAWKAGSVTATQAMKDLGLTRNTFYNLAKRYENK